MDLICFEGIYSPPGDKMKLMLTYATKILIFFFFLISSYFL